MVIVLVGKTIVVFSSFFLGADSREVKALTEVSSDSLEKYVTVNETRLLPWCHDVTEKSISAISSQLELLQNLEFETVFIDLPFQLQGFVDAYINSDISWDELIQNANFILNPYLSSDILNIYKPLFDSLIDSGYTVILINNIFTGDGLFLTYPEIPEEHNLDTFMYDYWSSNHRSNNRELILMNIDHCEQDVLSRKGEFYMIGDNGGFESSIYMEDTEEQLFVKSGGLGPESFLDQLLQDREVEALITNQDQSFDQSLINDGNNKLFI